MPTTIATANLDDLIRELTSTVDEMERRYRTLTLEQLNWKPNAETWSLGQCFDHIFVATAGYFPIVEQVLAGTKRSTFLERLPLLPHFFGNFLIRGLEPGTNISTTSAFMPTSSAVDQSILDKLIKQQRDFVSLMERCRSLDLDHIIITSPGLWFVVYSLFDTFRIVTIHAQHHLAQMEAVTKMAGFPMS